jgi:hypothetical protein
VDANHDDLLNRKGVNVTDQSTAPFHMRLSPVCTQAGCRHGKVCGPALAALLAMLAGDQTSSLSTQCGLQVGKIEESIDRR